VAIYETAAVETLQYGTLPTWGRHGGLLVSTFDATGGDLSGVSLSRLSAPVGVNGNLVDAGAVAIDLGLGAGNFPGAQVVDIWGDRSAFAYTGTPFDTEGGLVLLDASALVSDLTLIGGFGLGALSQLPDDRLLYTALSPVGAAAPLAAGLYVATRCDPGELCDGAAIATWGDATGPLAVDAAGNAFAVMTSFDGSQAARGWSAEQLDAGAAAGPGTDVFAIAGFGSPLAALAPSGAREGLLVFQAADATTFLPVAPIAVRYAIADGVVVAEAEEPFLAAGPDTPVSLVADGEERLWVGVPREGGGSTFVVLARR
jgi:hypothetical protein